MRILVAYDGSEGAQRAARAAAAIAQEASGRLTLLHVLDPRADAAHVQAPTSREAVEEVRRQCQDEARAFADTLMDGIDGWVEVVQRGEDISEAILRIAGEVGADMIAIATKRAGGLSGLVLGSVMQEILRDADCPLLVVRVK